MQTILGAGAQIGDELARELHRNHTHDIRLVSRKPVKVNATDELVIADLMDADATAAAVAGSDIAYLTVGLPADSTLWAEKLPVMMRNAIDACAIHGTKLVFFDNTYMYPKTAAPQTEETPFVPEGSKAETRALMATMLLDAMTQGRVEALIGRAPEFYGPGKTQGVTNSLVLDPVAKGEEPRVPLRDNTLRTLMWTPDASRALALLGNTPSAYGQTWHLPIDSNRLTYAELIGQASQVLERPIPYRVLRKPMLWAAKLVSKDVRELWELLPRYAVDNVFVSDKFTSAFPEFEITTYRQGIEVLKADHT